MCDKCFENNIYKFESEFEFNKFEKELYLKNNFFKIEDSHHMYLNDFHYVYKCKHCKAGWWLSIPDNAWRGYFLNEEDAKKHIEKMRKDDKNTKIGCLILFGVILIVFLFIGLLFYFNNFHK